jgi:hypothetical protein
MGHQHLRLLLEGGGDDLDRDVLLDGGEGLKHVSAHVEVDLAGQQQRAVVHLRAALGDGDIEAAGGIGAVGDRLIEAAMLGLGEPVGAEGDLPRQQRPGPPLPENCAERLQDRRRYVMCTIPWFWSRDCESNPVVFATCLTLQALMPSQAMSSVPQLSDIAPDRFAAKVALFAG